MTFNCFGDWGGRAHLPDMICGRGVWGRGTSALVKQAPSTREGGPSPPENVKGKGRGLHTCNESAVQTKTTAPTITIT
eukprot:5616859-Amphidinium_carterae.1